MKKEREKEWGVKEKRGETEEREKKRKKRKEAFIWRRHRSQENPPVHD